ncbi:unnamed protein product [Schistocephalus solidus]|uniref:Reverse transcriptase domain-containing protein n=1 Tax=Schistocephalus solidus TaxID=70667 RepID=A0A183S8X7_SCHSO|nr:unnamed protein product [Schistocephalus solidus]
MYADDLKVAYRYKPIDRNIVLELLKTDLEAFAQWCRTWHLSLSWQTYSVMVIGNNHQLHISIDGHDLNVPGFIKDLGISYSSSLNLSEHCSLIDTFQNFWVLTLLKLSSVLMAFTDSESCAGLHAVGNITGSADLIQLISQATANSRSPTYLLVQNTGSVTLNGEVLHRAPVLTRPCPEL